MENLVISFEIMGLGMLGIFAVMILVMICVNILNKVTGKKKSS